MTTNRRGSPHLVRVVSLWWWCHQWWLPLRGIVIIRRLLVSVHISGWHTTRVTIVGIVCTLHWIITISHMIRVTLVVVIVSRWFSIISRRVLVVPRGILVVSGRVLVVPRRVLVVPWRIPVVVRWRVLIVRPPSGVVWIVETALRGVVIVPSSTTRRQTILAVRELWSWPAVRLWVFVIIRC